MNGSETEKTTAVATRKVRKGGLRKRMIFYFLLIAFANILVAGEVAWEIKSDAYRREVSREVVKIQQGKEPVEHAYDLLDHLVNKFVIMVLILIVVTAVVLFLFVVRIASPIQYMIDQAERMAGGDLTTSIEIKSEDEISVLGQLINDLSVNLQEIVAQLNRITGDMEWALDDHRRLLEERSDYSNSMAATMVRLRQALEDYRTLQKIYTLYTIHHDPSETETLQNHG